MDSTLVQLINHLYQQEEELNALRAFITQNEGVLKAANAAVPGLSDRPAEPSSEGAPSA